jgi:acyl carrier protein
MTETTLPTSRRGEVVTAIGAALADVLDGDLPGIDEDSQLFDLGLDSTGVLELLLQLEDRLGVEFDTESLEMGHFETVRTLADFVSTELDG